MINSHTNHNIEHCRRNRNRASIISFESAINPSANLVFSIRMESILQHKKSGSTHSKLVERQELNNTNNLNADEGDAQYNKLLECRRNRPFSMLQFDNFPFTFIHDASSEKDQSQTHFFNC